MKNCHVLVTVILASVLLTAACKNEQTQTSQPANYAPPGTQATPDEFAAARAIYEKDCQTCHGPKGEGGPVKLEDGTRLKVPTFRAGHALRHSDADFTKQISRGGDGMPAFADKLKPEEMNQLIRFIRKEFQAGATPPAK